MSATNRGAVRRERDFYESPLEAIRPIMRRLQIGPSDLVVDPCCGSGRILKTAREEFGAYSYGWDIVLPEDHDPYSHVKDSLAIGPQGPGGILSSDWGIGKTMVAVPDCNPTQCIITNPPYSLALEFVQRALIEANGRLVCMLLPLSFMASKRRASFHKENPSKVFVLSKRPSFTDDGKTDACDYCWMTWGHSGSMEWEVLDV